MRIQTPAKINTLLYILGKREDGFHDLYMHMVPVNLYDTLTFTKNNKHGLNFQIKGASLSDSDEDNLVVKAVRAFEQVSRIKVNYDIFLEKKIPYGFLVHLTNVSVEQCSDRCTDPQSGD